MLDMGQPPTAATQSTADFVRTLIPAENGPPTRHTAHYDLATIRSLIGTGTANFQIGAATVADLPIILGLIEEAKAWLVTKGTSQWSSDLPDKAGRKRSDRVKSSLEEGATWLAWFVCPEEEIPVATVTIEKNVNPNVWPDADVERDSAAYLSRLVTARAFSGLRTGTAMLDWACEYAAREHGAKLIRIDVWTDNYPLHYYYREQGFEPCDPCPDPAYPSRARFQKATSDTNGRGPRLVQV